MHAVSEKQESYIRCIGSAVLDSFYVSGGTVSSWQQLLQLTTPSAFIPSPSAFISLLSASLAVAGLALSWKVSPQELGPRSAAALCWVCTLARVALAPAMPPEMPRIVCSPLLARFRSREASLNHSLSPADQQQPPRCVQPFCCARCWRAPPGEGSRAAGAGVGVLALGGIWRKACTSTDPLSLPTDRSLAQAPVPAPSMDPGLPLAPPPSIDDLASGAPALAPTSDGGVIAPVPASAPTADGPAGEASSPLLAPAPAPGDEEEPTALPPAADADAPAAAPTAAAPATGGEDEEASAPAPAPASGGNEEASVPAPAPTAAGGEDEEASAPAPAPATGGDEEEPAPTPVPSPPAPVDGGDDGEEPNPDDGDGDDDEEEPEVPEIPIPPFTNSPDTYKPGKKLVRSWRVVAGWRSGGRRGALRELVSHEPAWHPSASSSPSPPPTPFCVRSPTPRP